MSDLYSLTGDSFVVGDKFKVFTATLLKDMDSDELRKLLIGAEVHGQKIVAVELFAVFTQHEGWAIGLAVKL